MKKYSIIAIILWIAQLLTADPEIQILNSQINLGKLPQDFKKTFNITIKNIGDSELAISDISTSCGCTATVLSSNKITPNNESQIAVTFDTGKFTGEIKKAITIISNDKKNPRYTIYFTANIYPEYIANPSYLQFTKIVRRLGKKNEIEFKQVNNKKIIINDIEYNTNLFDITWEPYTKMYNDNRIKIILTIKPDLKVIDLNERIKINLKTDPPKYFTLFVTGFITDSDLFFDPRAVIFHNPDEIKEIKLKNISGKTFQIKNIENKITFLKVTKRKLSSSEYLVLLKIDKTKNPQRFTTKICIITNYPQEEKKYLDIFY